MRVQAASSIESSINVTPLIDVCLVLLIIFMVITPLMVTGVPVQLPKAATGESLGNATRQLQIAVKDDGTVMIGSNVVRREQVSSELVAAHSRTPDRPIAVRGDARVMYGSVVEVLDACRAAGFHDVGLVGRKE